mmetsp:Transcript_174550/g.554018  ORF Transcript_174550/g.554018 Transcript_174550/m.554018 type:complete len:536 (+) Transcript_174550:47-1654(+)
MKLTPLHALVGTLWAALPCGFVYTFSMFSEALAKAFDFSESQVSTIGMCQLAMGLATFTAGILIDLIGVRPALLIGCLVNAGAWGIFALIANKILLVQSPLPVFCALIALSTWGTSVCTGSLFSALSKNFAGHSSGPIGVAKAQVGIAGGVLAEIFVGLVPSRDDAPERLYYIYFLSASSGLFVLLSLPLIRVFSQSELMTASAGRGDSCIIPQWHLKTLIAITLLLVATTQACSFIDDKGINLSPAILIILALPALLLFPKCNLSSPRKTAAVGPVKAALEAEKRVSPWAGGPAQMLRRPETWLLWFTVFALMGGGTLLTTNLGAITASRSGPLASAATAVATFSCAQSLGRLFGGMLSDIVVSLRWARPWCFVALTLLMALAHGILCFPGLAPLYFGVILAGLAFGVLWPLLIVSIAELFGTERIASNYMLLDGSPSAIAGVLLAKLLTSAVYNAHTETGSKACHGDQCFRLTHMSMVGIETLACVAAVVLAMRAKVVYETSVFLGVDENDSDEASDDDSQMSPTSNESSSDE